MNLKCLLTLMYANILLVASTRAGVIEGSFTATVWETRTNNATLPGVININDQVTGSFRFSNTGQAPYSTLSSINEQRYVSRDNGSYFRVAVGGLVWESAGVRLSVRNDSPVLNDDLLGLYYDNDRRVSFPGVAPGLLNSGFSFSIFDVSSPWDLVASTNLPSSTADFNPAAVTYKNGSIFGNVDGSTSYYHILYIIDTMSFRNVPEPSGLVLMALGLGATAVLASRKGGERSRGADSSV